MRPPRRALAVTLLVAAAATLVGVRATYAFDVDRHRADAAAVARAADAVTVPLPPTRRGRAAGVEGRLQYRPGERLAVVTLEDLPQPPGRERYLVFLASPTGWVLAGGARPGPGGRARVRYGAQPLPETVHEVIVTRAEDTALSVPHGKPLLHWFDPAERAAGSRPFQFPGERRPLD